jgi:hypothetical protein
VKHAGAGTLTALEPLLSKLRRQPGLIERTPGSFYLRSRAFLHFHEDVEGMFADIKLDGTEFTRVRVTTREEQAEFVGLVMQGVRRQGSQTGSPGSST